MQRFGDAGGEVGGVQVDRPGGGAMSSHGGGDGGDRGKTGEGDGAQVLGVAPGFLPKNSQMSSPRRGLDEDAFALTFDALDIMTDCGRPTMYFVG